MEKSSKYIIAIICIGIIVFRMIFPNLNFDLISLALLAIATFSIFIKNPQKLFERTKRIKIGSAEWELQELNKETKKVEENTVIENEETFGMAGAGIKREKYSYEISTDFLPTEIIKLSIEIEKTLRTIYEINFQTEQNRPIAISKLINKLNTDKVINNDTFNLLKTFWEMRNKIIHEHNIIFSDRDYMSFVDIGIRILKVLKTIQFNKMDGKLPYYGIG